MYRVLIVEDDPMVAMINEQYTKRNKNFEVVETLKDGESALLFLKKQEVDLLVLDISIPRMDGFTLLRNIRSQQINVDVIMVTAANDRDSLKEALRLGVVDYVIKPFTFERFQMALEKFMAYSKALKDVDILSQKGIDYITDHFRKKNEDAFPKGIQEKTLQLIMKYLKENPSAWFTGDEVAEKVHLTGVTVRRYMNYLAASGKVISEINYETGGRPCMKYKVEKI